VPRQIILASKAQSDIREAYVWYEEKAEGLGDEFLNCLDAAFSLVAASPHIYPVRFNIFRRILIQRFPYAVYFISDDRMIRIYYVFHTSQNPEKLAARLRKA